MAESLGLGLRNDRSGGPRWSERVMVECSGGAAGARQSAESLIGLNERLLLK